MSEKTFTLGDVDDMADKLGELTPSDRIEFLALLQGASQFCWSCGRDLPEGRCHCENDD